VGVVVHASGAEVPLSDHAEGCLIKDEPVPAAIIARLQQLEAKGIDYAAWEAARKARRGPKQTELNDDVLSDMLSDEEPVEPAERFSIATQTVC
jgi:hypothetical protein